MVTEKIYNNYPELRSVIEEALPNWMSISDEQVNTANWMYDEYYIGTENMKASILVFNENGYPSGVGSNPAITISAKKIRQLT